MSRPDYDDGGRGSDDHDDDVDDYNDDADDYNDDVIESSNDDELSLLFFLDLKCCCEQNMLVLFV